MESQSTSEKVNPQSMNALLDGIESRLGRLSFGLGAEAVSILDDMDTVKKRLVAAEQQGTATKAEAAQFDSICAALQKDAGQFLKQIGGENGLIALRAQRNPPEEHWWWYLDRVQAQTRRQSMLRTTRIILIGMVVLAVILLVYRLFLTPDPKVIAEMNAQQMAERYFTENNLDQALVEIDKGLVEAPDSAGLLIYKAAILEAMGKTDQANEFFDRARSTIQDTETFALTRAQVYLMMNNPDGAITVSEQLIQEKPTSAKAYLVLGSAYEQKGDQFKALDAYEQASTVGGQSNDSTTVAQARIKMAMLMQVMGGSQSATITPEATP